MRFWEVLLEAKKVGREFQHLEDLVFTDPANGANRAVEILRGLEQDSSDVAIKWDGYPTLFWGRDENGKFLLVGKNAWGKIKADSAEEVSDFIKQSGKGVKEEPWREKFGNDMAALWPMFERATPENFRGFVYGDLLYHPGKPYTGEDGLIKFTPNKTTYNVKVDSKLGRQIAKSKAGVAATMVFENFGDPMNAGKPIDSVEEFKRSSDVVVLGQTYVDHRPAVDVENLDKVSRLAGQAQSKIKAFLEPRKGLADIQDIFYRYVNHMGRQRQLDQLNTQTFYNFAEQKVSAPKQERIRNLAAEYEGVMEDIFALIRGIMTAKDEVIRELDSAEADITANIGPEKGGEGYVKQKDRVKFVPRDRFTLN